MKRTIFALALLAGLPALAAEAPKSGKAPPGAQTREWLELQKRNTPAGRPARPVPGEVADKAYQRYVQSFTHPIPDQFPRDAAGGSGQGQ